MPRGEASWLDVGVAPVVGALPPANSLFQGLEAKLLLQRGHHSRLLSQATRPTLCSAPAGTSNDVPSTAAGAPQPVVVMLADGRLQQPAKLGAVVADALRRWYLETEKEALRGDVVRGAALQQQKPPANRPACSEEGSALLWPAGPVPDRILDAGPCSLCFCSAAPAVLPADPARSCRRCLPCCRRRRRSWGRC